MTLGLHLDNGAWLGHLSFLLLAAAILAPPFPWLRIGVALSALAGLGYALLSIGDPGLAFWQAVLLTISLAMLTRHALNQHKAKFTDEEEALRIAFMAELSRSQARHLMDQGNWINGRAGEELIQEGEAISHLFYLHAGSADISLDGKPIARCGAGELIGDATALSGKPASGTVKLAGDSRFWCISAPRLREYLTLHPPVRTAIERQINAALDAKLRAANTRLAGG